MTDRIHMFSGHLPKAFRENRQILKKINFIIEVVDARAPQSTQNLCINQKIINKPIFLLLNKVDLADPIQVKAFIRKNKNNFADILITEANSNILIKEFLRQLKSNIVFKKLRTNKKQFLKALVIGGPNTGKSTFINHIVRKRVSRTNNSPDSTKKFVVAKTRYNINFIDAPSLLLKKIENKSIRKKNDLLENPKNSFFTNKQLALWFINFAQQYYPANIPIRYKINHFSLDNASAALMSITSQLGMQQNFEKASQKILDDFRRGEFGKISLDYYGDSYL